MSESDCMYCGGGDHNSQACPSRDTEEVKAEEKPAEKRPFLKVMPRGKGYTSYYSCGCGQEATIPYMGGMFCNWCAP